jgi:hypothetical protein
MTKEEREELDEQIELAQLEVASLEEDESWLDIHDKMSIGKGYPARRKFNAARIKYLKKKLVALRKKEQAAKEYEEWDQRTKA